MPTLVSRYCSPDDPQKYTYFDPRVGRVSRLRRRIYAWANVLNVYLTNAKKGGKYRLVMVTLTYSPEKTRNFDTGEVPENYGWQPGHISEFMKTVRQNLNRRHQKNGIKYVEKNLLAYAWVAELQARGAVHYHVLLLVRRGTDIPYPDECGWWVYGSTRIEEARTAFYIVKYTSKGLQQEGFQEGDEFEVETPSREVTSYEPAGYEDKLYYEKLEPKQAYAAEQVRRDWSSTSEKQVVPATTRPVTFHKVYPKGLRAFAVWIADEVIDEVSMWEYKVTALPGWLRDIVTSEPDLAGSSWRRRVGGGWECGEFPGFWLTSEYEFSTMDRLPTAYDAMRLSPHEAKMRKGIRFLDENGDYIYKPL